MSDPPSTPPRRTLPWQQRRPLSSQRLSTAAQSQDTSQQPSSTRNTNYSSSSTSSRHADLNPPPSLSKPHRNSVSSISQMYQNATNATNATNAASIPPTPLAPPAPIPAVRHARSSSGIKPAPGTFAPQFIQTPEEPRGPVKGIEGESSDFSGRRFVWVRDPEKAFTKGEVLEDNDGLLTVRCADGSDRVIHQDNVDKVNPAKFDKADDMAELTHLNEASVVHNLQIRYEADLIYTYSGLFLVAINPYCPLPIYGNDYVAMYKNRSRDDTKPHIFAVTDLAFRNLLDERENQSILVTGESGAGKTENTKKVIQYLAAVATDQSSSKQLGTIEQQILQANPILEAFGNAQTIRNNNSSRFGKFIRIEFTRSGQIVGAFIDWYLLEKSRVVKQSGNERNYHIFYQLLRGATRSMRNKFLLGENGIENWEYTKHGNTSIAGVDDLQEFRSLLDAFNIMRFTEEEQLSILRVVAAVLHIGNVEVVQERRSSDDARLPDMAQVERLCHVLGIPVEGFKKGLLKPRVKAGREWVHQSRTAEQVKHSLDALAKSLYERAFGKLVEMVNSKLDTKGEGEGFIGVLDIAGFEIFQSNSFEQLCINYTNEKLQQFFNHHMFVLEQEEYARERIEWKFIDFGHDLQPTIDLIELSNPIGIFSCLDEDCVMPKATDKTFTEKLNSLWDNKTAKYKKSLLTQGFTLTHYAAEVEYNTEGWLEKNRDPLNDNISKLLAASTEPHIASLFADDADDGHDPWGVPKSRVKKGLFRTVAQRHKEQLSSLMAQLHSTHPHFVRCIIPNHQKKPKRLNAPLVLDQLRCNGVLEGIRIARTGFPNRLPFAEFRQRYEVLTTKMPKGYVEGQKACQMLLQHIDLDPTLYRVGITKVFFRAGVLAELEERRDDLVRDIITRFQCRIRGYLARRTVKKLLYRSEATLIIQRNLQVYLELCESPWWKLFIRMKPLLGGTTLSSSEVKKRDEKIQQLEEQAKTEAETKQRLEEERRKVDTELQKVRKTLESERALALDKEEIFIRLQQREADLSEKLAGALDDQDALEDQIDELMLAKRKAEDQAHMFGKELEQAGELIAKLEEEKRSISARLERIQRDLDEAEAAKSQRTAREAELERELDVARSQLELKGKKVKDLEDRIRTNEERMEDKLASADRELQSTQQDVKTLRSENQKLREELRELAATSTSYEDLVRRKESEISMMHGDMKKLELDRKQFEDEKRALMEKHDEVLGKLRTMQSEINTLRAERTQFEKEASDAKRLLQAKISEETESGRGRQLLAEQVKQLQAELTDVRKDLDKERQSRSDNALMHENKINALKRELDSLNTAKANLEKEHLSQQDTVRRALEARSQSEKEKRALQTEVRSLKDRMSEAENSRLRAAGEIERSMSRQVKEKEARMDKDLKARDAALSKSEAEREKLLAEVARLTRVVSEQDGSRQTYEQGRRRAEQEASAMKHRLLASENDNRALQNQIQQKNLEISKANAKASQQYRDKIVALTADKTKADESASQYRKQLEEAQIQIRTLEKQKEKLSLNIEDINHEVSREHQNMRNAEKAASQLQLQLAEVNRNLEMERQLKTQAQANTRQIQATLATTQSELQECHQNLLTLQKVFDPNGAIPQNWEAGRKTVAQTVDLAAKLDESHQALRIANERRIRAEKDLADLRKRHQEELQEVDSMHSSSKRILMEELNQNNTAAAPGSPFKQPHRPSFSNTQSKPITRNIMSPAAESVDSSKSDRTMDTMTFQQRMDLEGDIEELRNKLQLAEMRNKHIQAELDRIKQEAGVPNGTSSRRAAKLEGENNRLHDMLDDAYKKNAALESSMKSIDLSLKEVQAKSHEELYEYIAQQEQARKNVVTVYNEALNDLGWAKEQFDKLKAAKVIVEADLRETQIELEEALAIQQQDKASRGQLLEEFADLQIRLDSESSRVADLTANMNLYKARSEEYFQKLEQAEIAVLRASRSETFVRQQAKEAEETAAVVMAERKQMESAIEDLQRQNQHYEEKIEDLQADLQSALQAKKRLHNELEDYRSSRAADLEDKESSMEQTRKKYQTELSTLTQELELERENLVTARGENRHLREEVEDLRAKWDDEVLNSSTWAKEKSRLEIKLSDLSQSHDEAVAAHNELQSRVVTMLAQIRSLRANIDDVTADRDLLMKEKRSLEQRLSEANQRLEDLANGESPAMRNAAGMDRELLDLKGALAQQEDMASAAVERMRKAEALAGETQRDIAAERERNVSLHKEKVQLEKQVKDLQLRLVDLETKSYANTSHDIRFLHSRVQELENQLEEHEKSKSAADRSVRNVDRTVRDLQAQIDRRDKINAQLEEEIAKGKEKLERMLKNVEELQASESEHQLVARRAEREAREEREKSLRLERELEGWKGLRLDRRQAQGVREGSLRGSLGGLGTVGEGSGDEETGSVRGKERGAREIERMGSKRHSVNFL